MSSLYITSASTALLAGAGYALYKKTEEKYPPSLPTHWTAQHKEPVYTCPTTGKVYKAIGFFGGPKKVFDLNADGEHAADLSQRELYYGDLKTAQKYAKMSTDGYVGVVAFSERHPKIEDHAVQNFEGPHIPLSPQGQRNCDIKVFYPTQVNDENLVGIKGVYARFKKGLKTQSGEDLPIKDDRDKKQKRALFEIDPNSL